MAGEFYTPNYTKYLEQNKRVTELSNSATMPQAGIPDYLSGYRRQFGVGTGFNLDMKTALASITGSANVYSSTGGGTTGSTSYSGGGGAPSKTGIRRGVIPQSDWNLAKRYGQQYKVDPAVLVAIGMHETGWGKLGLGRSGLHLGVGAYDSGATMKYKGIDNQLRVGAKTLASMGVHNIRDIQAGKARRWATDPNWARAVVASYGKYARGSASSMWH